ncbi:hypothetical protein AC1031_000384 [Aphanomyces cochlioides]|nr:hypothetical protein AC1031_000384 [Aphanomyces cochlioides]
MTSYCALSSEPDLEAGAPLTTQVVVERMFNSNEGRMLVQEDAASSALLENQQHHRWGIFNQKRQEENIIDLETASPLKSPRRGQAKRRSVWPVRIPQLEAQIDEFSPTGPANSLPKLQFESASTSPTASSPTTNASTAQHTNTIDEMLLDQEKFEFKLHLEQEQLDMKQLPKQRLSEQQRLDPQQFEQQQARNGDQLERQQAQRQAQEQQQAFENLQPFAQQQAQTQVQ